MWKKILIAVVISLVVGLLSGWLLTKHYCTPPPSVPVTMHDTVFRDSIQIKEVVKWRYRTSDDSIISHDPIITADSDTILIPDDTIQIPIDHYEYSDSAVTDTSRVAWTVLYSGYKASIDTFQLDWTFTPSVLVEEKENGWGQFIGIGVSAGYGLGCGSPLRFEPFVGVTVTYGWGYHWKSRKLKNKRKNFNSDIRY